MATYDLAYPGAAIDAILNTAYYLQEAGYIFRGSASDYSGTPSKREWVIAPAGFTGFGITSPVPQGSIGICLYNGTAWVGKVINVVTIDANPAAGSDNAVSSGGTFLALATISQNIIGAVTSLSLSDGTATADQGTKLTLKLSDTYDSVTSVLSSLDLVAATATKAGLMSAADKAKVDAFLNNLRSLSFTDTTTGADVGTKIVETLKMTVGGVQEAITALTILAATTSKAGLMSATDKAYIDGLPTSLSTISTSISNLLAMLGYYECSTAAGTAAKTVSASGYVLTNGGCIRIKMTNANTADNVTLNINSTGAKALYYDGAQASATNTWEAGEVLEVYYDGTQYQCASGGGGKFATGEKVKETGITDVLNNSDDLPTSAAVNEAVTYQGEEQFVLASTTVNTNNNTYITPSKTESGAQWSIIQKDQNVGRQGHFTLPNLVVGKTYVISFDYVNGMTTTAAFSFAQFSSQNNKGVAVSSVLSIDTLQASSSGHYSYKFTYASNMEYLCFSFRQMAVGQVLSVSNISIKEETMLKDFVDDIYQDIYGVQTVTPRTDPPVSSGFLNSNKTRIRILYACSGHGRCVAKFDVPVTMTTCQMIAMKSYNPSTGTIDSSNTVGISQAMTAGSEATMEWDNDQVNYVLFNAFTGSTMTDEIYNTFVGSLNVSIFDIVGEGGIEQRLETVEELVEQGSSFRLDMLSGTNVKSLGAIGDGATDDTAAIQQALNSGGTIFIPNGTYIISQQLRIYSNTHLIMDKGATILRTGDIKSILFTPWEETTTGYNGQHDITIEGGTLDLNTGITQGGCGCAFVHAQNITIKDITIKHENSGYHCLDICGCKNVFIQNCTFTDVITNNTAAEMVQIDSVGAPASCPFIEYDSSSACYDNTPCVNFEISGCRFDCNAYSPAIGGHNTGQHTRINIHDNIIYGSGNSRVRGAIAFANATNATDFVYIHDNFIDNFYYGFQFAGDTPVNLWVKNNIFSRITNLRNPDSGENGTFESNITAVV